jgi:hypothetical protein
MKERRLTTMKYTSPLSYEPLSSIELDNFYSGVSKLQRPVQTYDCQDVQELKAIWVLPSRLTE